MVSKYCLVMRRPPSPRPGQIDLGHRPFRSGYSDQDAAAISNHALFPVDGWERETGFVDSSREEMEAILSGSHPVVNARIDATEEAIK